jgi:hypothetical protein
MTLRNAVGLLAWLGALLIMAFQSMLPAAYQVYAWVGLVALALIFVAVVGLQIRSPATQRTSPRAPWDVVAGVIGALTALVIMWFVFNLVYSSGSEWAQPVGILLPVLAGLAAGNAITWGLRRLCRTTGRAGP